MCEAAEMCVPALLGPESKAGRYCVVDYTKGCVLDRNSDDDHSTQLDQTTPVHRRDEVHRLLAATRSALANNRKQRQMLAAGKRRELRSHRQTIRTVLMRKWRASGDDQRWIDAVDDWPDFSEQFGDDCGLPEAKKILQAIQRHPEGVSIVEIGNELGVDFRRLLVSTDMLLASGQIDQVQELFYPAGR
jgi:hypothetical protein